MTCSNCYNGCTDIKSDRCVKYTGLDVPLLGIKNGDSLSFVEQAIIGFLTSAMDGSGIIPVINNDIICQIVSDNLPDCGDISLNDVLSAIIKSICSLQTQITNLSETVNMINGSFTVQCLTGVDETSEIHDVTQAIIDLLCTLNTAFSELVTSLPSTYVLQTNLENEIANYLTSIGFGTKARDRMVPYAAIEYYGPLTNFDASGAGMDMTGSGGLDWTKVYLCNGDNGTPDKRGRVGVGTTNMGGAVPMDVNVNPGGSNPAYVLKDKNGANAITLTTAQMPTHSHSSTISITLKPHTHFLAVQGTTNVELTALTPIKKDNNVTANYDLRGTEGSASIGISSSTTVETDSVSSTIGDAGESNSHSNIQPVLACYYIIYLP